MKTLTLNLKRAYFEKIRDGVKPFEFRLNKPYWRKRLIDREYDTVIFKCGYPSDMDVDKIIHRQWKGYEMQTIQSELFGDDPVEVFAINTTGIQIQ